MQTVRIGRIKRALMMGLIFLWSIGMTLPALSQSQTKASAFSYTAYEQVLRAYVDDHGMVDYEGLKAHPEELQVFLEELATLKSHAYNTWDEPTKIALWLNAYNALTLKAIIDHYPIEAGGLSGLLHPDNSIRQIDGVWDELEFTVMGRERTLDAIEHEILRKEFDDPRIHMALVCAAMGCPPLRGEPYVGARLDEQLDDQAKQFLGNPAKFRIERDDGEVHLSSIFKWFGKDFISQYGTQSAFKDHGKKERAVLNFVSQYLDREARNYLTSGNYSIEYLDYDWSLNEQKG